MFDQQIKMDICPGSEEPIILERLHLEPGEHDIDDTKLRTSYEKHIIEGHTVHCCMVCQYRSSKIDTDDSELRTSYETHIIEGHTVHRCMVCQYRSSIITNMKRHVRTHTGSKPFSCPHCGQRFARKENAIRHIRTIHVTQKCLK
ncbi:hypothetical protein AVEN_164382-1 [Araneus ventricosus]|uniref:C2H2-type domain-containing protein n=1 Tax=Araneus ventricosus TaxID=182803 RepID=A0A4Y2GCI7_ARAVE|nr:hypothetical protein AVEN_164382-1 [Araneus ventricosus]